MPYLGSGGAQAGAERAGGLGLGFVALRCARRGHLFFALCLAACAQCPRWGDGFCLATAVSPPTSMVSAATSSSPLTLTTPTFRMYPVVYWASPRKRSTRS